MRNPPLFTSSEWTPEILRRVDEAIQDIAFNDLGLDTYPNQIEIITTEQMLDAYSSSGMPLMYQHWSFGKHFARDETHYKKGLTGLAYEIVINSNPCVSYLMEDNTATMQTLVIAHAAYGHNHFFKNNYLFKEWTDAGAILSYLEFAKKYIQRCEERYGTAAVERTLDAAHALMPQGTFRFRRRKKNVKGELDRQGRRLQLLDQEYDDLFAHTIPHGRGGFRPEYEEEIATRLGESIFPEENLLYFLEKQSPTLQNWQREVVRIVRNVAQYFYPQRQTKLMNEGCATFVHHYIMNALYDKGLVTEGAMLEFNHMHSNVVLQPAFDDPRYSGINPYALGFAMMQDIVRICTNPTEEDREWFPEIAGEGSWREVLKNAWANYRDESFVAQYLSPHLMRTFRLFALKNDEKSPTFVVTDIHNETGYRELRAKLARSYDASLRDPDIQVASIDTEDDLVFLEHRTKNEVPLAPDSAQATLLHFQWLYGSQYEISLIPVDEKGQVNMDEGLSVDPYSCSL